MTSMPVEHRAEEADWFLIGAENRSAVRIRDGLLIGEDAQGGFQIAKPGSPGAWLRFEVEEGGLTIRVVAREWTLSRNNSSSGTSCRLAGPANLTLPNHTLSIACSSGAPPGPDDPTIKLTQRYSINWLKPTPAADGAVSDARAPVPPSRRPVSAPERAPQQRAAPGRHRPIAPGSAGEPAEPTEPGRGIDQKQAVGRIDQVEDIEPIPEPVPRPQPARPKPATLAVAGRNPVIGSRRRSASRREEMSWSTLTLAVAIYLMGLGISTPVQTPVQEEALLSGSRLDWAAFDAGVGPGLLGEVELLLSRRSPPDRATLEFAIEAYRLAEQRGEGDFSARRTVLEKQLAAQPAP